MTDLILTYTVYSAHKIRAVNHMSGVKKSHILDHLRIFLPFRSRNLRFHSAPHKCPLTISKCLLSVLWRCPSYREFGYSKITEKLLGPAAGDRLTEVSIKRELTVDLNYMFNFAKTGLHCKARLQKVSSSKDCRCCLLSNMHM